MTAMKYTFEWYVDEVMIHSQTREQIGGTLTEEVMTEDSIMLRDEKLRHFIPKSKILMMDEVEEVSLKLTIKQITLVKHTIPLYFVILFLLMLCYGFLHAKVSQYGVINLFD